jgi:hypothetical protein
MSIDIGQELMTFRPLSTFVSSIVVPAIRARVSRGELAESDLPLAIARLQILWDNPTGSPTVQLNDEVQIDILAKPSHEGYTLGAPITLADMVPGTAVFAPPTSNGKRISYFLSFSSFMDFVTYFDFGANHPDGATVPPPALTFPIEELARRKQIIEQHPPRELLDKLQQMGWPPSPSYYPALAQGLTATDASSVTVISAKISALLDKAYWDKRIALWEELQLFSSRIPYIRKAIEEYLEGDSISSIYVIVPQFEGIITDYVRTLGGLSNVPFKQILNRFKELIKSRNALLFPEFTIDLVLDYMDTGTFWAQTRSITDSQQQVNRHGIAHGVFTGFENREIALKYLILMDCLAFMLLHERIAMGTL